MNRRRQCTVQCVPNGNFCATKFETKVFPFSPMSKVTNGTTNVRMSLLRSRLRTTLTSKNHSLAHTVFETTATTTSFHSQLLLLLQYFEFGRQFSVGCPCGKYRRRVFLNANKMNYVAMQPCFVRERSIVFTPTSASPQTTLHKTESCKYLKTFGYWFWFALRFLIPIFFFYFHFFTRHTENV